jgi:hypothetical protein
MHEQIGALIRQDFSPPSILTPRNAVYFSGQRETAHHIGLDTTTVNTGSTRHHAFPHRRSLPLVAAAREGQPSPLRSAQRAPESKDAVVVGLGLRVTAAGHRSFVLAYRMKDGSGVAHVMTLGRFPYLSVEAARKRARKLKEEIELGGDPQGNKAAKRKEPTISKLADDWEAALARKVKAEALRQSTVDGYQRALRLHIRPQLGNTKISAITKKTVQRFHEQITLDGKPIQANRSVGALSNMLAWAVDQEMLAANPVTKAVKFRLGQMSIAGQWITKYTGSNSGLFIAEFDEVGNHYEGTICVWDSKPEYPNSSVYISKESNCFPQHFRGLPISHFDNLGTTLFPTTVEKLKENGIVLPETVDCTFDMKGNEGVARR